MNTIKHFENFFLYIVTSKLMPEGFLKTDDGESVDSLEKITAIYNNTNKVCVWTGASDDTIYSSPDFNHVFRAWHDYHHIKHQFPFTEEGERLTMLEQVKDIEALCLPDDVTDYYIKLLNFEVMGQVEYHKEKGYFPDNQLQFFNEYMRG